MLDAASAFLVQAGWAGAKRAAVAGDASARSYERLTQGTKTAILMNSPSGQADDPADFIKIARYLARIGLSSPRILAQDLTEGFLLLEDFGDAVFAPVLARNPAREPALYAAATQVLIHLARAPLPPGLPDLTAQNWTEAATLALTHYAAPLIGPTDAGAFTGALTRALQTFADGPRIFIHRDYHAENMLLLPRRRGLRRVGLLDFQLGQAGQPGYDLVSLLQDARRDVSLGTQDAMIGLYTQALGLDPKGFSATYASLGAQRALRILGIFARLARNAKPQYLAMMPRVWDHLQHNIAHPALSDLRAACRILPEPRPEILQRLVQP
jgi:aminoglycoside/choline kinase family phosphotransferase